MDCRLSKAARRGELWGAIENRKSGVRTPFGFTLIELLVVISIMALLAALTMGVLHGVAVNKYRSVARAELNQIAAALDAYKAQYGVYPPSNANAANKYTWPETSSMFPQLYYELSGVTNNNNLYYSTLDNITTIPDNQVLAAFGVGGFGNCSKGSGDDAVPAKDFLPELAQKRIASVYDNGVPITNLITSVGGPDANYKPLNVPNVNPFRYVCPGVNNPNGYDLWVELVISGKTNLICNWSTATLINNAAP